MIEKKNINQEVNKTLDSLNQLPTIKVKPFFYTRLMAKMEEEESHVSVFRNWSLATMALIILINVVSIMSLWSESQEADEVIELMASEYSLTNIDLYNATLE